MDRYLIALAWAIAILFGAAMLMTLGVSTGQTVFFAVPTGAAIAVLVVLPYRRRHIDAALPRELSRVAYKVTESSIAFAWKWRGAPSRMRILRSELRAATHAEDHLTAPDQHLIYDGRDDGWVDTGVRPRIEYRYTLFVADKKGSWREPIRLRLAAVPLRDQVYQEANERLGTYREKGSVAVAVPGDGGRRDALGMLMVSDPLSDPHGVDVQRAERLGDMAPFAIAGDALGGIVTDAIFATADLLKGQPQDDGWREVE